MQGRVDLCYMKADRPGIEPTTCKSQRPTAEPPCNILFAEKERYCPNQPWALPCLWYSLRTIFRSSVLSLVLNIESLVLSWPWCSSSYHVFGHDTV